MYIQQIYTNCLAQATYYLESAHEAIIIDPLRNPAPYIQLAKERNATIKYVLETHFHADFVSGHIDLANQVGASIVFGPNAAPGYKAYIGTDGERLHIGNIQIEIVHTPGHTIESTSYLVYDEKGVARSIFTGDTLFAGDVGRPDLLSGNLSKEELAAMMFTSIQQKIKTLPDEVIVYPGHGAGSACGKNIGTESQSTIGHEKEYNYALKINDKEEFIRAVTTGLPTIPQYFFKDAAMNKDGYIVYEEVIANNLNTLTIEQFRKIAQIGSIILDTRKPMDFAAGFIEGAINIGLNGDFAVWVGALISPEVMLLLVAELGREMETVERLARIGYDNVAGFLEGGMHMWFTADLEYKRVLTVDSHEMSDLIVTGEYELLDVRNKREVAKKRIPGSVHIPLTQLKEKYRKLGKNNKWLVYCAGGYRSMIAASFLLANGFHFVASLEGGINELGLAHPEVIEIGQETE